MFSSFSHSFQSVKLFVLKFIHTSSRCQNHYKVLNLKQNCSSKEIRDAYISYSKKYHPDRNKNIDAQRKFIAITEAYKTLSDKNSRRIYDLHFRTISHRPVYSDSQEPHYHYAKDPWKDPSFYHNRDKSQDWYNAQQPYYGIKGLKKVSNLTIVLICIAVMIVGTSLQVILIQKSVTFQRHAIMMRSQEAQRAWDELKNTSMNTTEEEQLKLLKERLGCKD